MAMSNPTDGALNNVNVVIDLTGTDDEASVGSIISLSSDDSSIASIYTVNDVSSTENDVVGTMNAPIDLTHYSFGTIN